MESTEGNGRNDKRKFKNQIFPFHMIMKKFHMTMWNGPEGRELCYRLKKNCQANFAWSCENFA